jgi:hypothetical protein
VALKVERTKCLQAVFIEKIYLIIWMFCLGMGSKPKNTSSFWLG